MAKMKTNLPSSAPTEAGATANGEADRGHPVPEPPTTPPAEPPPARRPRVRKPVGMSQVTARIHRILMRLPPRKRLVAIAAIQEDFDEQGEPIDLFTNATPPPTTGTP